MFYVDASGEVQLRVCEKGCGRLDVGNTAVFVSSQSLTDLMYVFRNLLAHVEEGETPTAAAEPERPRTKPKLSIVPDH